MTLLFGRQLLGRNNKSPQRQKKVFAQSINWSPDGTRLALGTSDYKVVICDMVNKGRIIKVIENYKDWVLSLSWSPSGSLLATGTRFEAPEVQVWDTSTWNSFFRLEGHTSGIFDITWFQDNKTLITSSQDATIRIWDTKDKRHLRILEGHTRLVSSVSLSRNDLLLATKALDDTVHIWRTIDWQTIAVLSEHVSDRSGNVERLPKKLRQNSSSTLAFQPSSAKYLATLGNKNIIRIWEIDYDTLLSQEPIKESILYTTAKLVLVGDSGVGKTG